MQKEFTTLQAPQIRLTCVQKWRERLLLNIFISVPQISNPLPLEEKMTSHVKLRRERIGLIDYETQIKGNIIY